MSKSKSKADKSIDRIVQRIRDKVEISVEAEQDDLQVRGNAMASGDDAFDRQIEDEINARLNDGDIWAWAHVRVTATLDAFPGLPRGVGLVLRATDSLGACSYTDEAQFRGDVYFEDMREAVIRDIATQIHAIKGV